ncbi:MAG: hypothetical protein NTW00_01810, partial [Hyphomicrobiales bacterium]|nr:hypothetical protein [Hyphomicrobiales bacterium]
PRYEWRFSTNLSHGGPSIENQRLECSPASWAAGWKQTPKRMTEYQLSEPPSLFGVLVSRAHFAILWVCEAVDPVGHMLLFAVGAMAAA